MAGTMSISIRRSVISALLVAFLVVNPVLVSKSYSVGWALPAAKVVWAVTKAAGSWLFFTKAGVATLTIASLALTSVEVYASLHEEAPLQVTHGLGKRIEEALSRGETEIKAKICETPDGLLGYPSEDYYRMCPDGRDSQEVSINIGHN